MSEYMLQTESLIKTYKQYDSVITAVNRVNIKVEKGEFVAIIGTSGSGKSTLLHILAGLDRPNAGTVIVTSSDDAYNAAGGSDGSGTGNTGGPGGGWGQGSMGGNTGNYSLTVNGGVVIAGGSSDMFSESVVSTKTMSTTSAGLSAGSVVTVTDQSGKVLGSMTFANAAQALVVYGGSTVYSGGTVSGSTSLVASSTNQNMKASTGGTISGGTQIQDGGSSGGNWGW